MTPWGRRKAVLAVNIPGRSPYAVFVAGFKRPRGKADYLGAGLPALVSTTDPTDVEILWDEVPSVEDQISERMKDALGDQEARIAQAREMQSQMLEAAQGGAGATGAGTAGAGTAGAAGQPYGPGVEMLAENAKRTLAYVKDPAMRRMLIAQYRAAGVRIEEEEEGG